MSIMQALRFRALSLASRPRVRGGAWVLSAFAARVGLQGGLFLLLARTLGPQGYGAFAASVAAAAIAGPYVAWGSGNLLIQEVSRRRQAFADRWGKSLITLLSSGVPLYALMMIACLAVFGQRIPTVLIACVLAADLLFSRLLDLVSQAYQAMDALKRVAQIQVLPNITRFIAGLVFAFGPYARTTDDWGLLYLGSTVIATAVGVAFALRELGRPTFQLRGLLSDLRAGFHFSVSLSAQTVYNDIDKAMLARISSTVAVGTYAAAYRIVDVAFVPVRAMLFSTYSQFFRNGVSGLRGTVAYARRLLPTASVYSALAGLLLFAAAPVVPLILGDPFAATAEALRWLALLPLLKSLHYLAADALTGAGFQPVRSRAQVLIAIINIAVNLYLIPAYSWRGAAWASLLCDGLLALLLWLTVVRLLHSQRAGSVSASPAALSLDEA